MDWLQISVLSYLPAAVVASCSSRWWGAYILLFNVATSLVVHRPTRSCQWDALDRVDQAAIAAWVSYAILLIASVALSLMRGPCGPCKALLFTGALVLSALALRFELSRRCLPWRTGKRIQYHALMHLAGAGGSLFLLLSDTL